MRHYIFFNNEGTDSLSFHADDDKQAVRKARGRGCTDGCVEEETLVGVQGHLRLVCKLDEKGNPSCTGGSV